MNLFFSFFIFQFLEWALKIKSFISLSFDKVGHNLPIFQCLELFINSIAIISFFSIVNLNYPFDAVHLGRRPINVLSPQMSVIVLLYYLLNEYFWLATAHCSDFMQVSARNWPHQVGRVNWISIFLVVLSPAKNTVAEKFSVFIVDFTFNELSWFSPLNIMHIKTKFPDRRRLCHNALSNFFFSLVRRHYIWRLFYFNISKSLNISHWRSRHTCADWRAWSTCSWMNGFLLLLFHHKSAGWCGFGCHLSLQAFLEIPTVMFSHQLL